MIDTHILIWLVENPSELSTAATYTLQSERVLGLSVMSCWEIALLVAKQRLTLNQSVDAWPSHALENNSIRLLPLSQSAVVMAGGSGSMDWDHGDPADRLIVATAMSIGASLVTADQAIHRYRQLTIW